MIHYPVTGARRRRESYIAIDVIRISNSVRPGPDQLRSSGVVTGTTVSSSKLY